jgi:hypothetical protein
MLRVQGLNLVEIPNFKRILRHRYTSFFAARFENTKNFKKMIFLGNQIFGLGVIMAYSLQSKISPLDLIANPTR